MCIAYGSSRPENLNVYLFGEYGDVFVEGLGRAHVTARYAWIPGRARG
jgi:hypothetical protein